MAKPAKSVSPAESRPPYPWPAMIAVALISLGVGAVGMRVVLRPQIDAAQRPTAPAVSQPPAPRPPAETPPPEPSLTAGQTQAQAARTIGNYYYDHADWGRALQSYAAAIRDGEDDANLRTDYANAYHFSGRLNEAIEQYRIAQKMDPRHEASRFNLGVLYAEALHDHAQARAIWEEFLRQFPNSERAPAAREALAKLASAPAAVPGSMATPAPASAGSGDVQRLMEHLQTAPPPKR